MNHPWDESSERRAQKWIILAFLTGLLAVAYFYDPAQGPSLSVCLFRQWAGFPCPACGITRSVCASMKGQWYDALRFHPLGPVVVLVFIGAWVREIVLVCMSRPGSPLAHRCHQMVNRVDEYFRRPIVVQLGIGLLLTVWIIRVGWLGWRDPVQNSRRVSLLSGISLEGLRDPQSRNTTESARASAVELKSGSQPQRRQ